MCGGLLLSPDTAQFRQFDHGYAVTSHSSQGLTAGRVLTNIDTESNRLIINTRLAYVAVSRASDYVRIYTNDSETLGQRLAADISKTAAVDFRSPSTTEQTLEAVQFFREHQPDVATERLQQQGWVHEYQSLDHRLAAVALDYAAQPDWTVVVAPDAAERRELTQLIRADLRSNGRLSSDEHSVSVLVEQKFPKALSPDEKRRLLEVCRKSPQKALYTAVVVFCNTGLQNAELRRARWHQVDFLRAEFKVGKAKTEGSEGRIIPLNQAAFGALKE